MSRQRLSPFTWSLGLPWVACALVAVASHAQPEELVTDRPDQTESSRTIPRGLWQLEVGASWEDDGEHEVLSLPGTLLRVGVHDRLELRLGFTGWIRDRSHDATVDGIGDGELGFKLALRPDDAPGPEVGLLAGTSLPWGDAGFGTERFDPSFRLAVTHDLPRDVSFAYNVGASWESSGTETGTSTLSRALATAAFGFALGERTGAFLELYGSAPLSDHGDDELSFDGGLTWLLDDTLQLDVAAGVGLSGPVPDRFVGIGLSYRRPR